MNLSDFQDAANSSEFEGYDYIVNNDMILPLAKSSIIRLTATYDNYLVTLPNSVRNGSKVVIGNTGSKKIKIKINDNDIYNLFPNMVLNFIKFDDTIWFVLKDTEYNINNNSSIYDLAVLDKIEISNHFDYSTTYYNYYNTNYIYYKKINENLYIIATELSEINNYIHVITKGRILKKDINGYASISNVINFPNCTCICPFNNNTFFFDNYFYTGNSNEPYQIKLGLATIDTTSDNISFDILQDNSNDDIIICNWSHYDNGGVEFYYFHIPNLIFPFNIQNNTCYLSVYFNETYTYNFPTNSTKRSHSKLYFSCFEITDINNKICQGIATREIKRIYNTTDTFETDVYKYSYNPFTCFNYEINSNEFAIILNNRLQNGYVDSNWFKILLDPSNNTYNHDEINMIDEKIFQLNKLNNTYAVICAYDYSNKFLNFYKKNIINIPASPNLIYQVDQNKADNLLHYGILKANVSEDIWIYLIYIDKIEIHKFDKNGNLIETNDIDYDLTNFSPLSINILDQLICNFNNNYNFTMCLGNHSEDRIYFFDFVKILHKA